MALERITPSKVELSTILFHVVPTTTPHSVSSTSNNNPLLYFSSHTKESLMQTACRHIMLSILFSLFL